MTKKLVERRVELYGGEKLSDLVFKYGKEAYLDFDQYYDGSPLYLVYEELETDDEYENRKAVEKQERERRLKAAKQKAEQKKKAAETEYKRYLELKEKYEKSE